MLSPGWKQSIFYLNCQALPPINLNALRKSVYRSVIDAFFSIAWGVIPLITNQ
jgi:hypothetical protein